MNIFRIILLMIMVNIYIKNIVATIPNDFISITELDKTIIVDA